VDVLLELRRIVLGVQHQEQGVAVDKVVIPLAVALIPDVPLNRVDQVVVAAGAEDGRAGAPGARVEGIPLAGELRAVLAAALDQVADAQDQLGAQQAQLLDGDLEDVRPLAAGQVGEDREGELVGAVVEYLVRPGGGHARDVVLEGRIAGRGSHNATGGQQR